eukprot:GHVS01018612.1.p1 GENE.GHVS01018612.1~~GHVS01018612.1.p1  ORF type:complete len:258 (+),score=77.25 GHVS01018612.1:80-775(+)
MAETIKLQQLQLDIQPLQQEMVQMKEQQQDPQKLQKLQQLELELQQVQQKVQQLQNKTKSLKAVEAATKQRWRKGRYVAKRLQQSKEPWDNKQLRDAFESYVRQSVRDALCTLSEAPDVVQTFLQYECAIANNMSATELPSARNAENRTRRLDCSRSAFIQCACRYQLHNSEELNCCLVDDNALLDDIIVEVEYNRQVLPAAEQSTVGGRAHLTPKERDRMTSAVKVATSS